MGSGTLPVGAYVTLEHEHILILRKGIKRDFKRQEEKKNRRESAFFWEERNTWFCDRWYDIHGTHQKLTDKNIRKRSGAYPFQLSYRLINMFSVYGDTILDPFLGTGTTTFSAIVSGRNSIGIEIEANFKELIFNRIKTVKIDGNNFIKKRILQHQKFIEKQEQEKEIKYFNNNLELKVISKQETEIKLFSIASLAIKENKVSAKYEKWTKE